MDKKVHHKMHKVKKQWVTIAVTGLSLGAVSAVSLGTNVLWIQLSKSSLSNTWLSHSLAGLPMPFF